MTDPPMKLHPRFTVPIPPGSYTCTLAPDVSSSARAPGGNSVPSASGIPARVVHLEVEGPQWAMEPSELFGAFPPANAIGPFAARLPQAVLRRKTMPWERSPLSEPELPWLALVTLADGEATYHSNVDPKDAYTTGKAPATAVAASKGQGGANAIEVSETVIQRAFPARSELHLLCHAREIDLSATEYGSSDYVDDDGIVSVVLSNRLPLPATAYGVYLISLEGQHSALRATGGPSQGDIGFGHVFEAEVVAQDIPRVAAARAAGAGSAGGVSAADAGAASGAVQITDHQFVRHDVDWRALDVMLDTRTPTFTFPVLASWKFECSDDGLDFEGYMRNLDVALVSTVRPDPAEPDRRQPVTLGTGHARLRSTSRRGDPQVGWYRGPLTPTKVTRDTARPQAHIADQVVKAVVEGGFDMSLSAAFEIGRLLAMSDPAFITHLRRWARRQFTTADLRPQVQGGFKDTLGDLLDVAALDRPLVGVVVGELFGGSPTKPWTEAEIEGWRTTVVPSVPVHSAVRLVEEIEGATLARGLGLDAAFVEATISGSPTRSAPTRLGVTPAREADFDALVRAPRSPVPDGAFEAVHRVGIANRVEVAQVFTAFARAGFEIADVDTGLVADVDLDPSVLTRYTPALGQLLSDRAALSDIPVAGVELGDIVEAGTGEASVGDIIFRGQVLGIDRDIDIDRGPF